MTGSLRWRGPVLDADTADLAAMLDDFTAAHPLELADDPATVAALVGELAALGIWTLGTAESAGGGGADHVTTGVAFERLGRAWPALGWAAVQAHAAVDLLARDDRFAELVARLHAGTAAVAVVDAHSTHVRLGFDADALTGTVDRVDAAAPAPHLLVLTGAETALLVDPDVLGFTPLRRTGLGGALTRSVDVDAPAGSAHELTGVDVAAARTRLRLGVAAVAAGIAGAAADAAVDYAAARRQFGAALTAIPTVRASLLTQASRAAVTVAAALAAATDEVQTHAAAREACDTAVDVAAAALQSHGGYGYLTEYGAERRLRDAVSLRAAADPHGASPAVGHVLVGSTPAATTLAKEPS